MSSRIAVALSLSMLLATAARADDTTFELFVDHGDTYVRAGTDHGLAKGTSLTIENEAHRKVGEAVVLEVWPSLARLSLDPAAAAAGKHLLATLGTGGPAPAAKTAAAAAPATEAKRGRSLKGHIGAVGFGPFKQLRITNETKFKWTKCELRLPDNRRYRLVQLAPGETEGIALPRFNLDGVARDVPLTSMSVKCAQGSARIPLEGL